MGIGSLMHDLAWKNPFYNVFYSTATIAVTVSVILFVALAVALLRRNKRASLGLGTALAFAVTAASVLYTSMAQVDNTFAYIDQTSKYDTPVTGLQLVGFPILMALGALALLGLFGKVLWSSTRPTSTKLLLAGTYLLGGSLFGTFSTSMAQDMFQVGSVYERQWSTVDSYFWLADFLLTCAVLAFGLITTARHLRIGGSLRSKLAFTTKSSSDADPAKTGKTHIARTVEATA